MTILTVTFSYGDQMRERQKRELENTDAPQEVRRNIGRLLDQEKEAVMKLLEDEGAMNGLTVMSETDSSLVLSGSEADLMNFHGVLTRFNLGRMFNDSEAQDNEYYPWLGDENQFYEASRYTEQ